MTDPTYALHVALIAKLDALLDCDVWDAVPPGAQYPYVTLDTIESANDDRINTRLDRRFVYLNVWSRTPGQAEVIQIMGQIDALNNDRLALDTGAVVACKVSRKRTSREPDNLTFMGQVTLEIITQH